MISAGQHGQFIKSEHTVQLFDSPESLGDAVARFLMDGLSAGHKLLLAAKPLHVQAIADGLGRRGYGLTPLIDSGRLIVLDAAATLRLVMKRGVPNVDALWRAVESTFEQLAPGDQRVSVYGELVEILAEEGNFKAAAQIEAFWNEFGAKWPISLFCGYSSAHFVMPGTLEALDSICALHDRVHQNRHDLLANWLLARRAAPPPSV